MKTVSKFKTSTSKICGLLLVAAAVAFIACAVIAGLGIGDTAYADTIDFKPRTATSNIATAIDPDVHEGLSQQTREQFKLLSKYEAPGIGLIDVNALTVPMNSDAWLDNLLDYAFKFSVSMVGYQKTTGSGVSVETENAQYDLELKLRAKTNSAVSSVLSGGVSTQYAALLDARVNGRTYRGESVVNKSIYDVHEIGVYQFTQMTIVYNVDTNLASTLEITTFTNNGATLKSSTSGNTYAAGSVNDITGVKLSQLSFILQTVVYYQSTGLAANLGINKDNRTYGASSDFRDLVKLHIGPSQTTVTGENYAYSTSTDANYDIAINDLKRFKFDYIAAFGLGELSVQSGADSSGFINLAAFVDYMQVSWYLVDDLGEDKRCDGAVIQVGKYHLMIEAKESYGYYDKGNQIYEVALGEGNKAFEPEYQLIQVRVDGQNTLYKQNFEIVKRDLKIIVVSEEDYLDGADCTIFYRASKEYDGTNNAQDLFSNTSFVHENDGESADELYQRRRAYWVDVMNGAAGDFDAIESGTGGRYISTGTLLDFNKSIFASSGEVGTNKSVYVKMGFHNTEITDGSAFYISESYNLILTYNNQTASSTDSDYDGYLTGLFEVVPNGMVLRFSNGSASDGEDKVKFDNLITYGDHMYASEYDFNRYLVMTLTKTNPTTGILQPSYRDDWRIIFQGGQFTNLQISDYNTVYAVAKLGQKLEADSDEVAKFTDVNGERYIDCDHALYAGQYYFYYDIYIVYKSNPTTYNKLVAKNGVFTVLSNTEVELFRIVPTVQDLFVNQKVLSITIHSCQLEKDYDGTDTVNNFSASVSGIIDSDDNKFKFNYSARYFYVGAGKSVPIIYTYSLEAADQEYAAMYKMALESYRLDTNNIISEIGENWSNGIINPLVLQVNFIEGNYEYVRKYNEEMYVAVRVAKKDVDIGEDGKLIKEDYYYAYRRNEQGVTFGRYVAESELKDFEMFNGCTYLKLEISGFLLGEGFVWHDNLKNVSNFMFDKSSDNPELYAVAWLDTDELLSWLDTTPERGGEFPINKNTNSSQDPNDKYRLELSRTTLPNYIIEPMANDYGWLLIEKLDVKDEYVEIDAVEATDYIYNAQGYVQTLFDATNGQIRYNKHPGAEEISAQTNVADMITVLSYVTDCQETGAGHRHNFSLLDPSVANLVYSGQYRLLLTIPETTNYNGYTVEFDALVKPKSVDVYVTCPFRVYDDDELVYSDYAYLTGEDEIKACEAMINYKTGDISTDPSYEWSKVYIYGVALAPNTTYVYGSDEYNSVFGNRKNYVLYVGLVSGETVDENEGDRNADVRITYANGVDQAMLHTNAVVAAGAVKHNYSFRAIPSNLFVKPRPLILTIDDLNQQKNYTGSDVEPDGEISDGTGKSDVPGVIDMYIIGYKTETYNDDSHVHAVETGNYKIMVRAKPDSSKGDRASNYEASKEWIEVNLDILPTRLELIEGSDILRTMYNGTLADLGLFNDYFHGVNDCGSGYIYAVSDWGKLEIVSCVRDGAPISANEIINAGVYDVTFNATVLNRNLYGELNVYFETAGANKDDHNEFSVRLTIEKSNKLEFTILRSKDVSATNVVQTDDDGLKFKSTFQMTYKGEEENFSYQLLFLGQDYSNSNRISVVSTVNNYLYGINQKIYGDGDVLGADVCRLTGINYEFENRPQMRNQGTYVLKYYLNSAEDEATYDPNFVSREYEITFIVNPAQLYVSIVFDAKHGANKIYRESNAYIETTYITFAYDGWVSPDEVSEMVEAPTVNWDDVPEYNENDSNSYDAPAGSHYRIKTQGGVAPANYELNHSRSESPFEVKRATATAVVYGFENPETGAYETYREYIGEEKEPEVARLTIGRDGKPERIDDKKEPIGDTGVVIEFKGKFIGNDPQEIADTDIEPCDGYKDVGKYVFAVSVDASQNYDAIPEKYYYFEITKTELIMNFVQKQGSSYNLHRGYSSKTYDGVAGNYPTFYVAYSGFKGEDAKVLMYQNARSIGYGASVDGIPELELIDPYYYIVESAGARIEPLQIGTYEITAEGGESKNYYITVKYADEGKPQLEITKRQIDIVATAKIQKTYDATNKIPVGAVTVKNYSYEKAKDASGVEIANSGLVAGDEIKLSFSLADSFFERINVHDDDGIASVVRVRIYGFAIDNRNYELKLSGQKQDEDGNVYFELLGNINAAQPEVIFTQDDGTVIINGISVVYDGEPHGIVPIVRGVKVPDSEDEYEAVNYTLTYNNEELGYPLEERPKHAGTYTVIIEVTAGGNYMAGKRQITMVIEKADVEITFGGDIVQTYGSIIEALSAKATGVGGYERTNLPITYYDSEGVAVADITDANAGEYRAVAVFSGDADFNACEKSESFTIKRMGVNVVLNISSSYQYNGKPVDIEIYFEYKGERYYPTLKYNRIVNGTPVPYNYGENAADRYPQNVGEYQVSTGDAMENFEILDNYWMNFTITPVSLRVIIDDKTVTAGQSYSINYRVSGLVSGDTENSALVERPSWEYYDARGNKLSTVPESAGTYRVVPVGASATNYVITYTYGILKLNKPVLSQQVNESSGTAEDVILEGSFAADVSLVVRQADTLQYNQYSTLLSAYSSIDPTIADYGIAELYNMRLSDGSVTSDENGMMSIKILCPSYFAKFSADTNEFYVAQISADGTVKIITAQRDGDYLVFDAESLDTFALLAGYDALSQGTNLDWLLYVGIAICVILVGVALLIVKLKD